MNRTNHIIFITGLLLAAGLTFGEETHYAPERYEAIIERSPFGSDPLDGVASSPEKEAQIAAAAAAKELRLCFLLESQSGEIRAGFQNLKPQTGDPKSVILMVGESFKGMKLLDIDIADAKATLETQGKPVVFELTKAPQAAQAPAARTQPGAAARTAAQQQQQPQRKFGGGFRRREPPPVTKPVVEQPKLSPEEEQQRREEVRKNLQEYQMEVIRQGMPPLPIPLTQEMDDQLVSEGVLPPIEEGVEQP